MEYIIRKCEESDLFELIELCKEHAEYEQAIYKEVGKYKSLEQALFSMPQKLYCLVVESNKELVGYFTYTFDFSTWDVAMFLHLDCLYLKSEFRNHKIGEKIMSILQVIAKQNNCISIQWQTPIFNIRAISFYERIGGKWTDKKRFSLSTL